MKKPSSRNFHTSDLMRALDARPHELRAWLQLEPLSSREKTRRSPTSYSALDVLFLAVVKRLDAAGFAPKALQTFSAGLYKALQQPHAEHEPDELRLYLTAGGSWKTGDAPKGSGAIELKLPLSEIRLHLLRYTGAHLISPQLEMALLASIQGGGSRSASNTSGQRRATR